MRNRNLNLNLDPLTHSLPSQSQKKNPNSAMKYTINAVDADKQTALHIAASSGGMWDQFGFPQCGFLFWAELLAFFFMHHCCVLFSAIRLLLFIIIYYYLFLFFFFYFL